MDKNNEDDMEMEESLKRLRMAGLEDSGNEEKETPRKSGLMDIVISFVRKPTKESEEGVKDYLGTKKKMKDLDDAGK